MEFCEIKDILEKNCFLEFKNNNIENKKEKNSQDILLDNVETGFTSRKYNTSNLDNGNDEIIKNDKVTITLTTSENQNKNDNNNVTTIYLGDCEDLLRKYYNITKDEKIYMKKLDIVQEGMSISKTIFDVYRKINGSKLQKLNKTICSKSKIGLSVPYKPVTDNLDKLNKSSRYYNDICYEKSDENGTYVPMNDRKNDILNGKNLACQENCEYNGYDYDKMIAICICDIEDTPVSFLDMKINKTKLRENFFDFKNIVNIGILKCYKTLFSKEGISSNIGFFIIMIIILIYIITSLIFCIKQYNKLVDKIKDIVYAILNYDFVKQKDNKNIKKANNDDNNHLINKKKYCKMINNKIGKISINKNENNDNNNNNDNDSIINSIQNLKTGSNKPITRNIRLKKNKSKKMKKNNQNPPIKKIIQKPENNNNNKNKRNNNNNQSLIITNNNYFNNNNNRATNGNKGNKSNRNTLRNYLSNVKKNDIINKVNTILKFTDDELNKAEYIISIDYDKRNYCQYYFSLLKTKHDIIFTFFYNFDYNSQAMKINLFFLNFSIGFTINALFFDDDTMHNIYISKGKFILEKEIPKIIYSSLISIVIVFIIKLLALSNDDILKLKQDKKKESVIIREKALISKLKIKFILFFVISTVLLIFFWCYLSMFCAVYHNTQYHLIKDTLISFLLSLLYPFAINIIPGIFRIPSLRNKKENKEFMYKFSKILQMF